MRVKSLVSHPFLVEGEEYLVYGLSFVISSPTGETETWILYFDGAYLWEAPLREFEIVDPRVSRHWEVQRWPSGDVTLWPPSFARDSYLVELRDWVPELVDDFKQVRRLLESEFADDLIREVIRGDRPWGHLVMAGVTFNPDTGTILNPWQASGTIRSTDLARGLLAHISDPDALEPWARLVLTGHLAELDLADQPGDEILLAAVWDASIGRSISFDAVAVAQRISG